MNLVNRRVMVTGGAGFIGSHLVDRLLEKGNDVVVYDNFDDFYLGKEQNVEPHLKDDRYKLVESDILNFETLTSTMKGADIVFHEAAQPGVRYSIRNPSKTHNVNVDGTLNVLLAAKENDVSRVVFASSSGIFGTPRYVPMDENHPTNPNSPYCVSKLTAEKYCTAFHHVYGMETVSLRYFSVYGPRGRPDQVIHAFTSAIMKDRSPVIFGDGEQTRDFTFVSDIVEATLLAAECEEASGEIFNIGYGREIDINNLLTKVIERLGVKGEVQPTYKETYRGEFPRTFADNGKARRILGWNPKVDLNKGLTLFIQSMIGMEKSL